MLDPRIVRVGIEIDGVIKFYDDLFIEASGVKYSNSLQGECNINITGLSRPNRDFILNAVSIFNKERTPKKVILEVGRVSTGAKRIYVGDIYEATVTQPPENTLRLKSKTGFYQKGSIISRSGSEVMSMKAIARNVAQDIGVALDFQATDRTISSYSFSGTADQQVEALESLGGIDVFSDGTTLFVKDAGVPLNGYEVNVSAENGMIGVPELNGAGIRLTMFVDKQAEIGATLNVTSKQNTSLSGRYVIYRISFNVSNRTEPFYYTLEASRFI